MTMDYEALCEKWNPWEKIPDQFNLGVALTHDQVVAGRGDKDALLWENAAGEHRRYTYRDLDLLSNRLASSLVQLGVSRGDRVFLRLPNVPEFYIAALAIAKLGGVFIPSSTQFREIEIEYRLKDSGAVAVITTTGLVDPIHQVSGNCPELQNIITVAYPKSTAAAGEQVDFAQLIEDGDEEFVAAATKNDDVSFIAYTSGTTGDPKGVVHLHRYPIAYDSLIRCWHDFRDDDIVACPSELGWLLPVASTFLFSLVKGLTVVLYDGQGGKFSPESWFQLFEKYRITNFTAPPTTYRMMMAEAEAGSKYDLSSWRHAVTAGEPLPSDTLAAIQHHFQVTPLDGIGMSECMVYCFNMIGMPVRPGSCGRPGPGCEIEIMDDDMNPLPAGTEGVLCMRHGSHPGMMKEYWNKPDQTAEVFQGEWYVSGDILARDDDGYFWFKGRQDDVINASGYRISPFEVESCLVGHPAVLEAAAIESPDSQRGMVVKAYVVLRPEFRASDALVTEIQEYAKRTSAPYKYPRKIEFVAALPKTTSGKVKRKDLRRLEADGQK